MPQRTSSHRTPETIQALDDIEEGYQLAFNDILNDAIMNNIANTVRIAPTLRSMDLERFLTTSESDRGQDAQTSPQDCTVQRPQALFATPTAKQSAGHPLVCTISTNSVHTAAVDSVTELTSTMVGMVLTSSGESLARTPSDASSPGGNCSIPLILAVTTTPTGRHQRLAILCRHFAWPNASPSLCAQ